MGKVRKQIYLEERQNQRLREVSQATGLSESEIIRRLIDQHLLNIYLSHFNRAVWEEEEKFIASLMEQDVPASARTWRREDLYDRWDNRGHEIDGS